jgi:hypothetical protein
VIQKNIKKLIMPKTPKLSSRSPMGKNAKNFVFGSQRNMGVEEVAEVSDEDLQELEENKQFSGMSDKEEEPLTAVDPVSP